MVSQEACSAAVECGPSASSIGVLPADVLYDVLLHLPAKTLCRLRAVSRSWRSLLTTDSHFAEAHSSRHRYPYIVTVFFDRDGRSHADTFDLSGNRLRRVTLESGSFIRGVCTHGNLACLTRIGDRPDRVCLINLATGDASVVLPGPDDAGREAAIMLGQAASSREHKLVCVAVDSPRQNTHVFVLGLGAGSDRRWRRKGSPPARVTDLIKFPGSAAVVQGTVYCLCLVVNQYCMVSFDLETEEWAPAVLPGPLVGTRPSYCHSLTELSGCLVAANTDAYKRSMDLWFLVEGRWRNRYHILLLNVVFDSPLDMCADPLFVFDDGRILLQTYDVSHKWTCLQVYDTTTNNREGESIEMRDWDAIGVCTGSLLCP